MSGGVDSSVAALLAQRAGHEAIGVFLKNGVSHESLGRPGKQGCCSVEDAADARRVADQLGIPFYALDYGERFERLIEGFVDDYARGRTPSPCVLCNTWLKLGSLLDLAGDLGASAIATGHYARREVLADGRVGLRRARSLDKDQSYFLASLDQRQLAAVRFPVGGLAKSAVRAIAAEAGLRTASKPESQEICFVPGGDYRALVAERRPESFRPGTIVDADGRALGAHEGHAGFTIGQRRGLGVALGEPVYVTAIDPAANRVTVGPRSLLARSDLVGERMTWVSMAPLPPGGELRCLAQVRHRSAPAPALARADAEGRLHLRFDAPVHAVAPGQALALYAESDPDLVLAGGWIAG